jgi:hypothetical protein
MAMPFNYSLTVEDKLKNVPRQSSVSSSRSNGLIGVEITYFSEAQLPKSMSLQRSLQNGKSSASIRTSFLQIGHFIEMRSTDDLKWIDVKLCVCGRRLVHQAAH